MSNPNKETPVQSVLIAKAIGIILVVMGHYDPAGMPTYWRNILDIIYTFHMPLFFALSGYLFGLGKSRLNSIKDYFQLLNKKSSRLLIPFITIAFIYTLIKIIVNQFIPLNNPVNIQSIANIFIDPLSSHVSILWYIYTLFMIFMIFPVIYLVTKKNLLITAFIILILAFIPWPNILLLNKVFFELPFFVLGFALSSRNLDNMNLLDLTIGVSSPLASSEQNPPKRNILRFHPQSNDQDILRRRIKTKTIFIILFITSILYFILVYIFPIKILEVTVLYKFLNTTLGLLGIVGSISLSILVLNKSQKIGSFFSIIGFYSMSIYLTHTIFESFIRIIFENYLLLNPNLFFIEVLLATAVGIIIPMGLEKYIFRRYKLFKLYLLGLR